MSETITVNVEVRTRGETFKCTTVHLKRSAHVASNKFIKRVKRQVSQVTGMSVDDISLSARWSSDGSEQSTEVAMVPDVEANEFVGQQGTILATVPSFYSTFKQYKSSSEERFNKLEAEISELKERTTLLQETSAAFMKVARRFLLDRARTKLITNAKLLADQPWSTIYNDLVMRGPGWLETLHLSQESLFLTVKGSGSAQAVGDKAAHKVNKHHVKLAVDKVDKDKAAWTELFNFVFAD